MREITVSIDPRDYMSDLDWTEIKQEVVKDLLSDRGPVDAGVIGDIIDARRALLRHRPGEAICILDRVITELSQLA